MMSKSSQSGMVQTPGAVGIPVDVLTWHDFNNFRVWVHSRKIKDGHRPIGLAIESMAPGSPKPSEEESELRLQLAAQVKGKTSDSFLQASSLRGIPLGQILEFHSALLTKSKFSSDYETLLKATMRATLTDVKPRTKSKVFDTDWQNKSLVIRTNKKGQKTISIENTTGTDLDEESSTDNHELRAKSKDSILIAKVYSEQSESGNKRPAKRTAEMLQITTSLVYVAVRTARKHGWLSSEGTGNAGGTLTKSGADEFKRIKGEVRLLEYLKQLDLKGK
jgi:hypothetical protein